MWTQPKSDILNRCRNGQGKLNEEQRSKLRRVMTSPSESNWQNAHTVVISHQGKARTLIQAVRMVDPSFPICKEVYGIQDGKNLTRWGRLPSEMLVARAIRFAVSAANRCEYVEESDPTGPVASAVELRRAA